MNKRTMQLWILLLVCVLYVQLDTAQAKKNSEEIIVINNTGGGGCGSGAKTIVKTDGGKKKKKGGHKIILMAGGGGKCGEKHHHHTKVVHVPVPVPVPVKMHEEKHHDHWGSASNTHEDNWASASSNEEVKPHHKGVKVSAASVPPHRPFNAHNHMMNRMEAGKMAALEPKSTGLLQTLLNNEKPSRPDKKTASGKSTDTAGKKKATVSSETKHDKENGSPATAPQLITHHHLIDPNAEMLPPQAAFGLMQPENMQTASIMQPAFLSSIPAMNEMHQQHLQAAAAAAQQQSQLQQFQQQQAYQTQASQLQQQQYQQQQSQIQYQQQPGQQPTQQQQQPTLEQQQMHEAMIQQQLQQLQALHMQQQFEQHLHNEHQKMQEAIAASIPQPLSQDSPLASQLPIPLPGQAISAPVFEPITNANQTDKTANGNPMNSNPMSGNPMNGNMPPFNELEIIPYEVQQQLQAAAHMRQFASHASEPHAPLKELPSNRENSLINYNREHFKEHFKEQAKNAKHQFEHITKDHPLEMSASMEAIAVQLPPNQSYSPNVPSNMLNLPANQNYVPNGQPDGQANVNELPAELLFNAPLHSFMMVKPEHQQQPNFDLMQSQQTIQVPVLMTEEEAEKPTIKRYRI